MLPVWASWARDHLDAIGPTSDDHVGKSIHLGVTHKGLLECFLPFWGQVRMVDGDVQWDVRSRTWTQLREHVRHGHFLTGAVMDSVIIALEVQ